MLAALAAQRLGLGGELRRGVRHGEASLVCATPAMQLVDERSAIGKLFR
jgi:hypothetical protein